MSSLTAIKDVILQKLTETTSLATDAALSGGQVLLAHAE
jgi:hypothetical protein